MNIVAKLIRGILWLLSLQPLKVHYFWSGLIRFFLKLFRYRRDVVVTNLSRSFPEKKYRDIRVLADSVYARLADIAVEAVWFGRGDRKRLHESHIVEMSDPEIINDLFESCPGVMVLFSHRGNWEMIGGIHEYYYGDVIPAYDEHCFTVVYKALSSKSWDRVMRENRCAQVSDKENCCVESREILHYIFTHRHEKRIYVFPTDQAPYRSAKSHPIGKFLNQDTDAMLGGATIAGKFGFAVVYMTMDFVERGRYRIRCTEICRDASAMDPAAIMRRYFDLLEDDIVSDPRNYLWTHKRWK